MYPSRQSLDQKSKRRSSKTSASSSASSASGARHWEFGGPIGTWITMWSLPLVNYWMLTSISTKSSVQDSLKAIGQDPYNLFLSVFSLDTAKYSILVYVAWFFFQVLLHFIFARTRGERNCVANGTRLDYYLNGFKAYLVSLFAFSVCLMDKLYGTFGHRLFDPTSIFDQGVESYFSIFLRGECFCLDICCRDVCAVST